MYAINLLQGTEKVLPGTIAKANSGENIVETLKITNMTGTKSKIFSATIRSASSNKAYNAIIAFYGVNDPEHTKPSLSGNECRVRCSCDSFYFYYSYADYIHEALYGRKPRPYERKTPKNDPRYPPKNPMDIPGVCKHLVLLIKALRESGYIVA